MVSLEDREPAGSRSPQQGAQVAAERGRGRPGGRVLDDAAGRERVPRVEGVRRLRPEGVHGRPATFRHERAQLVVVVGEVGEPVEVRRRHDRVVVARVGDVHGIGRVEVGAAPAERVQQPLDGLWVGRRGSDRWRDEGRGGPGGRDLGRDRDRTGWRGERERARPVPVREGHGGRDGRVPAEGDLGLRAEVADGCLVASLRDQERRLGVPDLAGDLLHLAGRERGRVEHDTGGVASPSVVGERGVAQDVGGHRLIVADGRFRRRSGLPLGAGRP